MHTFIQASFLTSVLNNSSHFPNRAVPSIIILLLSSHHLGPNQVHLSSIMLIMHHSLLDFLLTRTIDAAPSDLASFIS
jgi:hypothetical protein